MNKLLILGAFAASVSYACAQNQPPVPTTQPFGKIDLADLQLKSCDFEPDANAEILFNKGEVYYELGAGATVSQHIRIKILTDFGKSYGNVKIAFPEDNILLGVHNVFDVEAETFNLEGGKIITTRLDKSLIYTEKTDRSRQATVFTMPNVQVGSVIEYRYKWHIGYFPTWRFQSDLPTRYSEVKLDLPAALGANRYRIIPRVKQPFAKEVGAGEDLEQIRALNNIHSLPNENFMGARSENLQRLEIITQAEAFGSWEKIGDIILKIDPIGGQFSSQHLSDESALAKQAKLYKTDAEKIAFLFDTVKNRMKWNDETAFFSIGGVGHAWDNKSGSTAEINIALYLLLKRAGVKAYPMMAGTRNYGKINPVNPSVININNIVVYVPIDSAKFYILDASNRNGLYNVVPENELNTFGLSVNPDDRKYEMVFMQNELPATQSVDISATVATNGKITGSAEISSDSYHKTTALDRYYSEGKEKYNTYLQDGNAGSG